MAVESPKKGRVLVACPTYAGKEYALDEWLAAFNALTHTPRFAYQVDNTRGTQKYFELLKTKGIDCTYLAPWSDWDRTFYRCWQLILERAKQLDCYWVFSVEADNTPAPESLGIMIDCALLAHAHLVTHAYPMHQEAAKASGMRGDEFYYHELGCMLMSRAFLERVIDDFEEYGQIVSAIFSTEQRYLGGYVKLTNRFKVGHLDNYRQAFANLGPSEIPGLIYPAPSMPADVGAELPPVLRERV